MVTSSSTRTCADDVRENLAAAEITLSPDEMDTVTALDSSARIGPDPAKAAFTQM